jgi:hypothetical protein
MYAAPTSTTPITDPNIWVGMPMTWLGADDSLWSLTDRTQGIVMKRGVRGLGMAEYNRFSTTSPAVAGSRHKGSRAVDREVFWPVKVFERNGSIEWMKRNRAFWRSMDPDIEGTWTVHHPDGATRSLRCRFLSVDDQLDKNPLMLGWHTYPIRLLADSVFWSGQPVTRSWKQSDSVPFYGPGDPLFTLSSGTSLGTATFTNDGDEPAHPVWQGVGPFTALTVGVEGQTLSIPFEVVAGKAVEIDTDPIVGQRLWYGDWDTSTNTVVNRVNRTTELSGDQRFVPIPAGDSRELSLTMEGAGLVAATITPRYRSAL